VTAVLDAYPDWKIPCHVLTIIPTADRQKATVKVRITFDKLDPRILPDMTVKVAFLGEETKGPAKPSAALLVPQSAIHDEAGQKIVYVVKDKHVERRTVRVGANVGSNMEILSGVLAGDSVVVHGPAKLQDTEAVEIKG
jgi:RND family efflux transporter MFP subunit